MRACRDDAVNLQFGRVPVEAAASRVVEGPWGGASRALGGCHLGGSPSDSVRVSPCAGRRESDWLRANEPVRRARPVGGYHRACPCVSVCVCVGVRDVRVRGVHRHKTQN